MSETTELVKATRSKVPVKADAQLTVTLAEYGGLQTAFDLINRVLFGDKLPEVLITYQRRAHSRGYFLPDSFVGRAGEFSKPEIALNPDAFVDRDDEQIVSTLTHEMVHLWQEVFGTPAGRGYHNREWAEMMKAIGLMPSSTGVIGGKETGAKISHFIIPNGPFAKAFAVLAATGWKLNLQSTIHAGGTKAPPSKVKFTCPGCGSNVWGKPTIQDICGTCNVWRVTAVASSNDAN